MSDSSAAKELAGQMREIHMIERAARNQDVQSSRLCDRMLPHRSFCPGEYIIRCGGESPSAHIIVSGMASRSSVVASGRRQFTALLLAGAVIGIESLLGLKSADSAVALTHLVCRSVSPAARLDPATVRMLLSTLDGQTAASNEWIINLGGRPAAQRAAYFFYETLTRMRTLGTSDGPHYPLPLTQTLLADFLALTPVHVNRCLRTLGREGLAWFHRGQLTVPDPHALARFSHADSG